VEARLPAADNHTQPEFVGRAEGSTKKNAEQEAARQLLEYLASRPEATSNRIQRKERG
jgi:dsRNA-specific ribonuclease